MDGCVEWASSDGLMPADDRLEDFETRSGCNRKEWLSMSEGAAERGPVCRRPLRANTASVRVWLLVP